MIPSGDLKQRLENNIQASINGASVYQLLRPPQDAIVVETEVAGEASVVLALPEGCLCIQWTLPTGLFRVLRLEKNADGAFILQRADGSFEAHVVECKKDVNRSTWPKARTQMRWTLSRLRALAGVLGIELRRGVLYTAYRTADLPPESAPNPTAQRRPIGPLLGEDATSAGLVWARRVEREWVEDEVSLAGFDGHFVHCKIQLDERGVGSTRFACE